MKELTNGQQASLLEFLGYKEIPYHEYEAIEKAYTSGDKQDEKYYFVLEGRLLAGGDGSLSRPITFDWNLIKQLEQKMCEELGAFEIFISITSDGSRYIKYYYENSTSPKTECLEGEGTTELDSVLDAIVKHVENKRSKK